MKVDDFDIISIKRELVEWTFNQVRFGYTPESIMARLPSALTLILKERNVRFDAGEKVKFVKRLSTLMLALQRLIHFN